MSLEEWRVYCVLVVTVIIALLLNEIRKHLRDILSRLDDTHRVTEKIHIRQKQDSDSI